jgi:glycosyltransferase involved in cell wall biosynthesis
VSRPRVLFVSRGRIALPLAPWLARKWEALSEVFEVRALNPGTGSGDARFRLLPESSFAFYPGLAPIVGRVLRAFDADAVVASDPYVGAGVLAGRALARSRAKVIVEAHGDPKTFARLYGSPVRRAAAPLTDLAARVAYRRADATRAVSTFTANVVRRERGLPPTASFLAYSDLSAFADVPRTPVPEARAIAFVGALELYKNIDGLAAAWRDVVRTHADARLTVVGSGSRQHVLDALVREFPRNVVHEHELPPDEVSRRLDSARALVLPSYPEGLGRVALEAFARGRGVVGTDGGGIPDIVTHEHDGLLVPPHDTRALVAALRRVLEDHAFAARIGAAARETYDARWHQTPADFAQAYRDLVERVLAGAR